MNIAIEYFLRNNCLKNFFSIPSSLFLESDEGKQMIICFSSSKKRGKINLEKHDISKLNEMIPEKTSEEIELEDIFINKDFFGDFYPIKFFQNLIKNENNSFNHPMEESEHIQSYKNFFNSSKNKNYKKNWLWERFCESGSYLEGFNPVNEYFGYNVEKKASSLESNIVYTEMNNPKLWIKWVYWSKTFLFKEKCSTELIFLKIKESVKKNKFNGFSDVKDIETVFKSIFGSQFLINYETD